MIGACIVWAVMVAVVVTPRVHAVCEGLVLLTFARVLLWKKVKDGLSQKDRSRIVPSVCTEIRVIPKSHLCKFVEIDLYHRVIVSFMLPALKGARRTGHLHVFNQSENRKQL